MGRGCLSQILSLGNIALTLRLSVSAFAAVAFCYFLGPLVVILRPCFSDAIPGNQPSNDGTHGTFDTVTSTSLELIRHTG